MINVARSRLVPHRHKQAAPEQWASQPGTCLTVRNGETKINEFTPSAVLFAEGAAAARDFAHDLGEIAKQQTAPTTIAYDWGFPRFTIMMVIETAITTETPVTSRVRGREPLQQKRL